MSRTVEIIRGTLLLLAGLSVLGWALWWALKRSDDPARLLFKWVLTAIVVTTGFFLVGSVARGGDAGGQIGGVLIGLLFGLVLAAIWRQSLSEMIAKPFGNLYDGGTEPPEAQPFYSIANARRKQGKYQEAIHEIQGQLARFPNDPAGQMLIAEIQAENLNDLVAAQLTVDRFLSQTGHTPRNIAYALHSMADWQLKFAQDREAARQSLERILELLPESEEAHLAAQRIAHLASGEELLAPHDRRRIQLKHGIEDLGLRPKRLNLDKLEGLPAEQAEALVRHLEQHPLDADAREQLARIYSDHYQRLDLAADQLEQMIQGLNQPARELARWLNLLADLQVKHGSPLAAVQGTLQRIIDLNPAGAAADLARQRQAYLKLEYRKNEKSQTLKLGSYDKDMGLKQGRPAAHD